MRLKCKNNKFEYYSVDKGIINYLSKNKAKTLVVKEIPFLTIGKEYEVSVVLYYNPLAVAGLEDVHVPQLLVFSDNLKWELVDANELFPFNVSSTYSEIFNTMLKNIFENPL